MNGAERNDTMRSAIRNTGHHGASLRNAGSCGTPAGPSKRSSQISCPACNKMYCAMRKYSNLVQATRADNALELTARR